MAGVADVRAGDRAGPAASARSRCSARLHGLRRLRHPQAPRRGARPRRRPRCRRRALAAEEEARHSVKELAQDRRDRALPRQAALDLAPASRTASSPSASPRCGASSPSQYGFVVPEIKLSDDLAHPAQDLPDQDPRHGRRQRGAAHRRRARHHRRRPASPTCPATRRASRPSA